MPDVATDAPTPPKLSVRGRRVLEKAMKAMRTRPETFDMADWFDHDPTVRPKKGNPTPYCGTVACLAGHIVLASVRRVSEVRYESIPFVAVKRLGLVDDDGGIARRLFHMNDWPDEFADAYDKAERIDAPARRHRRLVGVTIRRVRHWLKTGE